MTEAAENKDTHLIKTTQAALGTSLPVGVVSASGQRSRDFAIRPWRLKEEKELGKLRAQHGDATLTQYVSMILATMCTKLGGVDLESLGDVTKRRLFVSTMYVADVFYTYLTLRINAIGPEMSLKLKCPKCGHDFDFMADLTTTEIWQLKDGDLSAAEWTFKFKDPIQLRSKTVTGLRLGPARWSSMEDADVAKGDMGTAKAVAIIGSTIGFLDDSTSIVLAPHELDEMSKRDVEALLNEINDHGLGPVMSVEAKCKRERCGREFMAPIDWGYDSFFSISSR
ncbi:MAG: hypothetical protein AB7W59_00135 [Acidimicrobiia bacterium]